MHLLFCKSCRDVFVLGFIPRSCGCGKCRGRSFLGRDLPKNKELEAKVFYHGDSAVVLYIEDNNLLNAVDKRASHGMNEAFRGFVMPVFHPTLEQDDGPFKEG